MALRSWVLAVLLAGVLLLPSPALAAPAGADFPLPGGHFYGEANGRGGAGQLGFAVLDRDGIPFWTAFSEGGGVAAFGYPISRPFPLDGFTDQAMQKAVFQWDGRSMAYLNVLDFLHQEGKDGWLQANAMTPPPLDTVPDSGLSWPQVVARHQRLLDADPALRAAYFAVPDPLARYGLPLTPPTPEADGTALVVRCQRAVLQQWLTSQPWAAAGQVTVANACDLAKAAGVLPLAAIAPQSVGQAVVGGNAVVTQTRSQNWAGYVVLAGAAGGVTDVVGSWIVPTVDCVATRNGEVGVWVGLDGILSNTVENTGISATCTNGQAAYAAWQEAYPVEVHTPLALTVQPGDRVTAEVAEVGNATVQFTVTDHTTGQAASARQIAPGERASAEWIVQIPTLGRDPSGLPIASLPPFSPVTFTNAAMVAGGVHGVIRNPAWQAAPLTIVAPWGADQAVPSPLSPDGSGFQVAWQHP